MKLQKLALDFADGVSAAPLGHHVLVGSTAAAYGGAASKPQRRRRVR